MRAHTHTSTIHPPSGISLSLPSTLICTVSVARPRNTTQANCSTNRMLPTPATEKLRGKAGTDMTEPLSSQGVHWALLTFHLLTLPPTECEFNLRQVLSTWGERWTFAAQTTSSWFAIQKDGSLGLLASLASNLRDTGTLSQGKTSDLPPFST